ncbi:MAG: hypothetical protein IKI21_02880 [Oscillospiraceae bacterium]|nr:hypothetical protein [Oscillospiraceae bacterium]
MANTTQNTVNGGLDFKIEARELLGIIAAKIPGGTFNIDTLLYPEQLLSIRVRPVEVDPRRDTFAVLVQLTLMHPWFEEPMVLRLRGMDAHSPQEAFHIAMEGAIPQVAMVLHALRGGEGAVLTAAFPGTPRTFRLYADTDRDDDLALLAAMRDKLPTILGTKRVYWGTVGTWCFDGKIYPELHINDVPFESFDEALIRFGIEHDFLTRNDLHPHAAFRFLLVQDEATWERCPYTVQTVGDLTFRILYTLCSGVKPSPDLLEEAVKSLAPDPSLATELVSFLPEIVAQQVLEFRDSDILIPVKKDGGTPDVRLTKPQVRSYGYMEDAVRQFLLKQRPTREQLLPVLGRSARADVLRKALLSDVPITELKLSELVYFVDDDYKIW